MIWHNAARAQNGTITDVKSRERGFAVDVKTEILRKEYDHID